jgi:hypothetical protein
LFVFFFFLGLGLGFYVSHSCKLVRCRVYLNVL